MTIEVGDLITSGKNVGIILQVNPYRVYWSLGVWRGTLINSNHFIEDDCIVLVRGNKNGRSRKNRKEL